MSEAKNQVEAELSSRLQAFDDEQKAYEEFRARESSKGLLIGMNNELLENSKIEQTAKQSRSWTINKCLLLDAQGFSVNSGLQPSTEAKRNSSFNYKASLRTTSKRKYLVPPYVSACEDFFLICKVVWLEF